MRVSPKINKKKIHRDAIVNVPRNARVNQRQVILRYVAATKPFVKVRFICILITARAYPESIKRAEVGSISPTIIL